MKEVYFKLKVLFILLLIIQFVLTGCGTKTVKMPISPIEEPNVPKLLAVVAARYPPESKFLVPEFKEKNYQGESKLDCSGVLEGAGCGMLEGLGSLGGAGGCSGEFCAPALLLLIAIAVVGGGTIGAVKGYLKSNETTPTIPENDLAEIKITQDDFNSIFDEVINNLNLPKLIANEVEIAAYKFTPYSTEVNIDIGPKSENDKPDYSTLNSLGFGGVIEVKVTKLIFQFERGNNPFMNFYLAGEAHFIDTTTGQVTISRGLAYQSPKFWVRSWLENEARLLGIEIKRAGTLLAERIVENFLLGVDVSQSIRSTSEGTICGVALESPPSNFLKLYNGERHPTSSEVATLKPLLKWQSFPPPGWQIKPKSHDVFNGLDIEDVRYDLRIWQSESYSSHGELIYERIGLTSTEHKLEISLEPLTEYNWSVRPRFMKNGKLRADRWSASAYPKFQFDNDYKEDVYYTRSENGKLKHYFISPESPCDSLDFIFPENYFRFKTPPI